ncbi:MAG: PspC domain-containing protein [Candidatus Zixiibacteriota bacterium]
MSRRLYRSSTNKVIAGICGGLGEHLDIDPTLVRLVAVIAALASFGVVLIFYLLAWIIIPQPPPGQPGYDPEPVGESTAASSRGGWRIYLPGLILVGVGLMLLLREYVWWFQWHDIWPILLVVLGLMLILRNSARSRARSDSHIPPAGGAGMPGGDGGIRP